VSGAVVQYGVVEVAPELLRPDLCSLPVSLDAVLPRRPDPEGGLGEVGAPYGLGQPLSPRRVHAEGVAYGDGVGGTKNSLGTFVLACTRAPTATTAPDPTVAPCRTVALVAK
jgi:hypothetical protein